MSVSKSLRFQVLRRDNHTCRYCGRTAPEVKLAVDHVNPTALGGRDEPENLVTACEDCNNGKSATPPDAALVADVAGDALRWSAAVRSAADAMLADLEQRDATRSVFDEAWNRWGIGEGKNRTKVPRPADWAQSVDSFLAAGLPIQALIDCIEPAMTNRKVQSENTFRYFCGVARRKIEKLHDSARAAVDASPARQTRDLGSVPEPRGTLAEAAAASLLLDIVIGLHSRGLSQPLILIRRDLERHAAKGDWTPQEAEEKRFASAALAEIASVINGEWDTQPLSPGFRFAGDPAPDPQDQVPPGALLAGPDEPLPPEPEESER